jgi:hypothetical protein
VIQYYTTKQQQQQQNKQTMSNATSLTVGCGVGGSGVAGIGVGDVCCAKIHHKFTIESIEQQHQ